MLFRSAAVETAPELVVAIHRAHVEAGAQVVTTNTLCAHASDPVTTRRIAAAAVDLARQGADDPRVCIAGSIGPVRGQPAARRAAYREAARSLADAGADILLVETMVDPAEAALAVAAALELDATTWLAIACDETGRFVGGQPITALFDVLDTARLGALLVGCTAIAGLEPALRGVASHVPDTVWRGAYPNTTGAGADLGVTLVRIARDHALDVVGGCCGTDAAFLRTVASALHDEPAARSLAWTRLHEATRSRREP